MEVGGDRYRAVGGIHRIPIDDVPGRLLLAGLEVVGPDPAGALEHVGRPGRPPGPSHRSNTIS